MSLTTYKLEISHPDRIRVAAAWLKLGVVALLLAGLFSVLLVLSRTPAIQEVIPFVDFFHVALVVHVDLSVLIWFVSFACLLWSLLVKGRKNLLDTAALFLAVTGTLMIVAAPFLGVGKPLMNNYIPILDHPFFLTALGVFALGMLLQIIRTLTAGRPERNMPEGTLALATGVYLGAWVALLSLLCLFVSYLAMPGFLEGKAYYEVLFWGAGHILQFTHTVLLLVAWVWIAQASGADIKLGAKSTRLLFILAVAPVIFIPWIYMQYELASPGHRLAFTDLMKYGGLASTPLGFIVVLSVLRSGACDKNMRPVKAALVSSILLFAAGGVIGFMIEGVNVVIPAHYHGSIVGITLAFMGLAYHLLPQLGYTRPTSTVAHWQPYVYGGGQLMHILGLAWSGGYGVQRKTAGAAQGLENLPEIAGMAMMGLGGAISIIGGVLFVIVMIKAFLRKESA